MKILAVDDQPLILMAVEKKLKEFGYEVKTAGCVEEGIQSYNSFKPDLVLLDMNMPEMSGKHLVSCTGIEVVKYIRVFLKKKTPIVVMSGNTNELTVMKNFILGIDDYLKKPVSLDEMIASIKRIIGAPKGPNAIESNLEAQIVRKNCVGVVIPCHNKEEQLLGYEFKRYAEQNAGYHLCFVNIGSTDNTLQVLYELQQGTEANISIYDCDKNIGIAEAVRKGVLYLAKDSQLDFIGYLDADLSTEFKDFDDLVKTLENSQLKIESEYRINGMAGYFTKVSVPKMISETINLTMQKILAMPFKGAQYGAKIMTREIAQTMFQKKFITKWLFDVEIFMRVRTHYGKNGTKRMISELPLKRWIHVDRSKMKNLVKIGG